MLSIFPCACEPFAYLLWRNIYLSPVPIFKMSFYTFWILDSFRYQICNIFSYSIGCHLASLIMSFDAEKLLWNSIYLFSFVIHVFGIIYKTPLPNPVSWKFQFSSGQLLSRVQLFATPWTLACQASLSITNSRSPPKPMSIKSVIPSNHLILCHSLLLLPSIFPSISVFSNESALHIRWPKYWSFSFNISPSNENSGLSSFRMDWLDLLAVQRTLKSLLQHHSSIASVLWCSAFFIEIFFHENLPLCFLLSIL